MRLLLLFLLASFSAAAQKQLASTKTSLHKNEYRHQAFMAADADNSKIAVYLADKEKLKVLRYNDTVFFTDSLVTKRPAREFLGMEGYSFNGQNATVYWGDKWLNKIEAVNFDFATNNVTKKQFKFTYGVNEDQLVSFSENNSFYLLTMLPKGKLRFSIFNGTEYVDKVADFSPFHIVGADNKKTSLNYLIKEYGMQKIERKTYNSLMDAGNKIKLYVLTDRMLLTLDNNPEFTQVFTIALDTFEVTAKSILQAGYEKDADANSFYFSGKLYRILLTDDRIRLSIAEIGTGNELKSYTATKNDAITFKNTPLYTERGVGAKPSVLENTERFLKKARGEGAAVAVYGTPEEELVTVGATRIIEPFEQGIVTALIMGEDAEPEDYEDIRTTYFESVFDANFNHIKGALSPLAIDFINEFSVKMNGWTSMRTIMPFNDFYILGYYNKIAKSYVLEKYTDGVPIE
ncbi:hypothetical protein [uncultured Flavobacterium sp.]|uniref:hypothetical protein n=1 Tax=uncultured Flavobacterium sp. TaxID=165435 RepID=UPI0025F4B5DF|nr:hypothetical protein [uncultured Flavobacterium sp.]